MSFRKLSNDFSLLFSKNSVHSYVSEAWCKRFIDSYRNLTRGDQHELVLNIARSHRDRLKKINIPSIKDTENELNRVKHLNALHRGLRPNYHHVFCSLGRVPGGVNFLMGFRENLLNLRNIVSSEVNASTDKSYANKTQHIEDDSESLRIMDEDLKDILITWFSAGILQLQRITWQSPSLLLQKVAFYEAVHPVRNWMDMKRRVGLYKRCFIYTQPSMPGTPLVILHTALTKEIPSSMDTLLPRDRGSISDSFDDEEEDILVLRQKRAAIFYSISSPHKGLKGIDLGNSLIKHVVEELKTEFPYLSLFSSLSPIPKFSSWLISELHHIIDGDPLMPDNQVLLEELNKLSHSFETSSTSKTASAMKTKLLNFSLDSLEVPLMRLCAFYLLHVKHRGNAFDPVANFHLRNGAVLWRLNWNADTSPRILNQSYGIMTNYRYFLQDVEANAEAYVENKTIKYSDDVSLLLNEIHSKL